MSGSCNGDPQLIRSQGTSGSFNMINSYFKNNQTMIVTLYLFKLFIKGKGLMFNTRWFALHSNFNMDYCQPNTNLWAVPTPFSVKQSHKMDFWYLTHERKILQLLCVRWAATFLTQILIQLFFKWNLLGPRVFNLNYYSIKYKQKEMTPKKN